MTPHWRAWRLGLFTLLGLALLLAAVVAVFGLRVFDRSERARLHFEGSLVGLSPGAPVLFRGLPMGSVTGIGVAHDGPGGSPRLPVEVTLGGPELDRLLGTTAQSTAQPGAPALPQLLQRGLSAQLVTSSLLTGQRYIELDLAAAPAVRAQVSPRSDSLPEIPTVPAPLSACCRKPAPPPPHCAAWPAGRRPSRRSSSSARLRSAWAISRRACNAGSAR